jgi:hypothetical protein
MVGRQSSRKRSVKRPKYDGVTGLEGCCTSITARRERDRVYAPYKRRELPDPSPQLQDLLSELWLCEVGTIQTDHRRRRRAQPPTRRRARDAEIRGEGHVPGAVDEMPKAVVVALLRAGGGRHGHDHRRFPLAAQLLEDDGVASAGVTTTRAGKCRMSVGTALLRIALNTDAAAQ